MALSVLKCGEPWDIMAQSYGMSAHMFEKLVSGFMEVITDHLLTLLVKSVSKDWPMERLKTDGKEFKSNPTAYYALDVRFQPTNCPSSNHLESKLFFSGRHHLYGLKTKVAVFSVGLAIHVSKASKGSVADKVIMMDHLEIHKELTSKMTHAMTLEDTGLSREEYPVHWAIIANKGYQGAQENCRMILPNKKPRNGHLSLSQKLYNQKLSSDRIIVENFFGRLCNLWGLLQKKYRWSLDKYDLFNQLGVALTNFHILKNPLQEIDHQFFV